MARLQVRGRGRDQIVRQSGIVMFLQEQMKTVGNGISKNFGKREKERERYPLNSPTGWSWPDTREGSLPSKSLNVNVTPAWSRFSWTMPTESWFCKGIWELSESIRTVKKNGNKEQCAEWADSGEWLGWSAIYEWKDREIHLAYLQQAPSSFKTYYIELSILVF